MKSILMDYAITRISDNHGIVYNYDHTESLNIIIVEGQKIPFIDTSTKEIAFLTKTRQQRESDDENSLSSIELATKTKVARESDDNFNAVLELQTKTFTNRESDDQSFTNFQ